MTTTSLTSLPERTRVNPLGDWRIWICAIALLGLFVAYHHVFLQRTWMFAMTDRNWSHVLVVPLISVFYIYQHRHRLAAAELRPGWWGLPILFLGLFGYAMGIYPIRNDMAQGYSLIVALFGGVLWLLGPAAMRVLWFPIAFLVFAVKVSDRIWERIAWELQQIAAEGAVLALKFMTVFFNFDVARRGATIDLMLFGGGGASGQTVPLNIAEACSGLRMLMALVALATAMAFLWPRAWWQRLVMIAMAVPIALLVNIMRVTSLGLVALADPAWIEGALHTYIGMSMLLPAGVLFWGLGWVLDRCVIRSEPTGHEHAQGWPDSPENADARFEADTNPEVDTSAGKRNSPAALPLRRRVRVGALALMLGVLVTLLAGATYAGMIATPVVQVPVTDARLMAVMQLLWTLAPPALVGGALGTGAMLLLRRRAQHRSASNRALMFTSYAFTVGVLMTMVAGHSSVLAATRAVLIKDPLPLRHGLWMIPGEVGPWVLEHEDPALSSEQIEALGTRTYTSRVYRNRDWPTSENGSLARLHVAYYTGTPDTVPHVPERCFVAAGLQGLGKDRSTLELDARYWRLVDQGEGAADTGDVLQTQLEPRVRIPSRRIDVSHFTFAHPDNPDRAQHVFYFFIANGRFLPTPDMVRLHGFDPTDQYSYYCKVEIQILNTSDGEQARQRAEAMMAHLLPEILACLPDWEQVRHGEWPTPEAAARARRSGS